MTEHDLPQAKVVVVKDGKHWYWEHNGCSLYVSNAPGNVRRSYPFDSYPEAIKGALTHTDVHKRF